MSRACWPEQRPDGSGRLSPHHSVYGRFRLSHSFRQRQRCVRGSRQAPRREPTRSVTDRTESSTGPPRDGTPTGTPRQVSNRTSVRTPTPQRPTLLCGDTQGAVVASSFWCRSHPKRRSHAHKNAEDRQPWRELVELFKEADTTIVSDHRGLSVVLLKVRRELRAKDIQYRVIKNRLAKIAAEQAGLEELIPLLTGPSAIAVGAADEVLAGQGPAGCHQALQRWRSAAPP